MSGILTPGYLRWDGTKYVLDQDVEIVGPAGSQGPSGPTGPAGPPGPNGTASGDLLGTYPGPISVVGLTGISGVVSFGSGITSPTITQVTTGGTTGENLTYRAQNATTFGGNVVLQSGTGTTAGLVQFLVGASLAGYFDANRILRLGPSATSTFTGPNGVGPVAGTDYFFGGNAAGSIWQEFFSGANAHRAAVGVYNTGVGAASTNGISIQAPGTTFSVANYAGQAVIEQSGPTTAALVFGKVQGDGTNRAVSGRIFQSGVWTIGDLGTSSSSFSQAGLTGPFLSFAHVSGALTTTGGQATIFKTFAGGPDEGTLWLQGNTGINLLAATTNVASVSTTKFITNIGRRVKVLTTTATTVNVTASDEIISIGTLAAPCTVNLPATPTVGDTYTIKDANGSAGTFNITVSGNGVNIDGGFASITIMTNFTQATFVYNGTTWISSLTNNVSPNAGYTSVVNVPGGGSTTVTGFDQLVLCDTLGGTTTVTAPATPQVNMRFTVKDANNNAATNNITVQGNGRTLESPTSPGTYASPTILNTNNRSATWAYDPTRNRYTLISTVP
jgi:hypothetical protein